MSLHRVRTHPEFVDGCYACHLSSLHINHTSEYHRINTSEKVLSADLAAYKRLRKEGLQPPSTTGAAELEKKAQSAFQVERANNAALMSLPPSMQKDVAQAVGVKP